MHIEAIKRGRRRSCCSFFEETQVNALTLEVKSLTSHRKVIRDHFYMYQVLNKEFFRNCKSVLYSAFFFKALNKSSSQNSNQQFTRNFYLQLFAYFASSCRRKHNYFQVLSVATRHAEACAAWFQIFIVKVIYR